MFYHANDAAESNMGRAMLCFTIETAVGGRGFRWRLLPRPRCGRSMLAPVRPGPRCNGGSDVRRTQSVRNTIGECNWRLLDAL